MVLLSSFALGLIIGSFLNVVVLRMERGVSFVTGRSRCSQCRTQLGWYDNIPLLSFLLLRGRCRYCEMPISWQYPLMELLTGVLFLLAFLYFPPNAFGSAYELVFLLGLTSFLIVIGLYDFRTMEIPLYALYGAALWTLWWFIALEHELLFTEFFASRLGEGIIGALVIGGFFASLVAYSKETWMGWGDVWLGAFGGLVVGWDMVPLYLTFSFGLGSIVGIMLLLLGRKNMKSPIPFGPFLCVGILGILYVEKAIPNIHAQFFI